MIVRRVSVENWRIARTARLNALAEQRSGPFGFWFDRVSQWSESDWRDWVAQRVVFVAESHGELHGSAAMRIQDGQPLLEAVWVQPIARGTGISDALIAVVWDWARAGGHRSLRLWFSESNEHARALYVRLGFVETGRRRPAVDDRAVTEVEMTLSVDEVARPPDATA